MTTPTPVPRTLPRGVSIAIALLVFGGGTAFAMVRAADGVPTGGPAGTGSTPAVVNPDGLAVTWQARYSSVGSQKDRTTERLHASYVVGDVVVRVQSDGIVGYRAADGAQAWGTPLPDGAVMCSASRAQDEGYAAIAYGTATTCATVSGIDLRTGKLTFTAKVKTGDVDGRGQPEAPKLGITSGHVVASAGGQLTSFTVADGAKKWSNTGSGQGRSKCAIGRELAVDHGLAVVTESCLGAPAALAGFDPATGSRKWTYKPEPGTAISDLVSAVPVVAVTTFSATGSLLLTLDGNGKALPQISTNIGGKDVSTKPVGLEIGEHLGILRYPYHIVGTTMYVPLHDWSPTSGAEAQWVALDLASGVQKWLSAGHQGQFIPIRADEQGLLGYEDGGFDLPGRLVLLAAADGTRTEIRQARMMDRNGRLNLPYQADIHQVGDMILFMPVNQILRSNTTAISALK